MVQEPLTMLTVQNHSYRAHKHIKCTINVHKIDNKYTQVYKYTQKLQKYCLIS